MKLKLLFFIAVSTVLSSCLSNKPFGNLSSEDYNGRRTISKDAKLVKKVNTVGVVTKIAGAVVGGLLASNSNMVSHYDGTEQKNMPIVNAGIGGLLGFGVTSLITHIAGQDRADIVNTNKEAQQWLRQKKMKGYISLDGYGYGERIVRKSSESNFGIRNLKDLYDFKYAFPNSSYTDDAIRQAINYLDRKDLPKIIEYYPNTTRKNEVAMRYLQKSSYIGQYQEVARKFPSIASKAQAKIKEIQRQISKGTFNGYTDLYMNGDYYIGYWKNGKKHGKGTYKWKSGGKYEGSWVNGNMQGQGTYTWKSGEKYSGKWQNDERKGYGTYYDSRGQWRLKGNWVKGECRDCERYKSNNEKLLEIFVAVVGGGIYAISQMPSAPASSYSYNNSSYNDDNEEREENNTSQNTVQRNKDGYSKEDLKKGNVRFPDTKNDEKDKWQDKHGDIWGKYHEKKITFTDGTSGLLFQGGQSKRYFISVGGPDGRIYYRDKKTATEALYIYKKYGVVMNR